MNLRPEDVDSIEEGGILNGQPVKLLRSKGGFWMGICGGKLLTGASHPAIVKYTISKMFPSFQPSMCKSLNYQVDALVEKHSHFLSDNLRKSGHDIYSIQNGNNVEFQITRDYMKVASLNGTLGEDSLELRNINFPKEFLNGISGASTEKALSLNIKKIKIY